MRNGEHVYTYIVWYLLLLLLFSILLLLLKLWGNVRAQSHFYILFPLFSERFVYKYNIVDC